MTKNLKIKIKNEQLAGAVNLGQIKAKLAKKKTPSKTEETEKKKQTASKPIADKKAPKKLVSEPQLKTDVPNIEPELTSPPLTKVIDTTPAPQPANEISKSAPKVTVPVASAKQKTEVPTSKKTTPASSKQTATPSKHSGKNKTSFKPLVNKKSGAEKEYHDIMPLHKKPSQRFDQRGKGHWKRKSRGRQGGFNEPDTTIRPDQLTLRLPITIKQLATAMKIKASQLLTKLFSQGLTLTLNDHLEDETTVQLLGDEFNCKITIDTSEEKRIRITDRSIKEEIQASDPSQLKPRAPIVAFMGHVDHGKTSLIDAIRKSNRASKEAGSITQHIGAFTSKTPEGSVTILDTPGHEAFSAMRGRGAEVTDIVLLVVAGDEGIRAQTIEALQHAKAANVTIVVAINKCDKEGFDPEQVYRQLSEYNLIAEQWGGNTITINCSATTGENITELTEMLALQSEMLELKANPQARARGTVLESEMHKGLGSVATILIQNGTLNHGDAVVFAHHWGLIKTMHDENGKNLRHAGPSTPVEITGLSGLPEAGNEFIAVKNEKEAKEIASIRSVEFKENLQRSNHRISLDKFMQHTDDKDKKILNLVLRADVHGSLEALKSSLLKIISDKVDVNIIYASVGDISESDIHLAVASKAPIIGFHTHVESHAEELLKKNPDVLIVNHDVIYHVIYDVKKLMVDQLDKIAKEEDKGKADIKAVFKASKLGKIAGCLVVEGSISRNHHCRLVRDGEVVWKGRIASLKRDKEDARDVKKGLECGILLENFTDIQTEDQIQAYEVIYLTQEL